MIAGSDAVHVPVPATSGGFPESGSDVVVLVKQRSPLPALALVGASTADVDTILVLEVGTEHPAGPGLV